MLEEFDFVLVLILMLVLIGLGRQIGLGSKIPFYLLSYLSICHSQNYGVKNKDISWERKGSTPCIFNKKILQAAVCPSTVRYHMHIHTSMNLAIMACI